MIEQIKWKVFKQWDSTTRHKYLDGVGKHMLAETAVFQQTNDMLSYHNRLSDLIHLLQTAQEKLQNNDKNNEWQQQTITALLTDSLVFQHLASQPPDASAKAPDSLVHSLQAIVPIDAVGLNRYLAHLSGYTHYQWRLEHLADHPPQNMAALMIEFLAYAHGEAGVPYGRTNLLRQLLPTYFVERRTGQLNPRQDIGDLMRHGRPIPKPPANTHPLLPDSDTLQRFLAKLLNYDPVRPYPAATLFTLMPTWLTFLQARQLLPTDAANSALDDLSSLKPDLLVFYESFTGDDGLMTAVRSFANLPKA